MEQKEIKWNLIEIAVVFFLVTISIPIWINFNIRISNAESVIQNNIIQK